MVSLEFETNTVMEKSERHLRINREAERRFSR